jgi:hypothetical protein
MNEIEALRSIRDDLVEQRRQRVARRLDNPTAGSESIISIAQIQDEIETIDRAIADELAIAKLASVGIDGPTHERASAGAAGTDIRDSNP